MNLDFGTIVAELTKALGGIFAVFNVETETGRGLLNFVTFFGMIGEFFISLISKISGGLAG